MPMATISYRKNRHAASDASFQVKLNTAQNVSAQGPSFDNRQSSVRCSVGVKGVNHPRVSIVQRRRDEPKLRVTHPPTKEIENRSHQYHERSRDAPVNPEQIKLLGPRRLHLGDQFALKIGRNSVHRLYEFDVAVRQVASH